MRWTWLGWAGVELEHEGETVVIDPLEDAGAVFAAFGVEPSAPAVMPASAGCAVAGLVTHLHRDHADAAALAAALRAGAPVLVPPVAGGEGLENLGLAQADTELAASGLERRELAAWDQVEVGSFTITALPASDGLGDPQVAWLVEAGGVRALHLGDTMLHGGWWRMALRHGPFDVVFVPVNGAVVRFPHRRPASPLPVVLDPGQAVAAVRALGARLAVPIHAEGYEVEGAYVPVPRAAAAFAELAEAKGVPVQVPELGAPVELALAAEAA